MEIGLNNCANDIELLKSMLEEFISLYENSPSHIKELYEQNKIRDARLYAIEIKESALNFGAFNLVESVATLEYELEKGLDSTLINIIDSYTKVLHKVIEEINTELNKIK